MRNEILEYFRKANGQFVSGQQISADLNVSRTAIWKHINILKARGYIFESSTRKGYRLIYAPNLLTPLELTGVLRTESFGRHIVYMESASSTNEEAKIRARRGAEEGTLVIAEEQVTGHGRLTRGFYSPYAKGSGVPSYSGLISFPWKRRNPRFSPPWEYAAPPAGGTGMRH